VPAHRAVLAACSHYFYSMFTSELTESRQDTVTLCQIDGSALNILVDFMYTSEIRVAEDNVQVGQPSMILLNYFFTQDVSSGISKITKRESSWRDN